MDMKPSTPLFALLVLALGAMGCGEQNSLGAGDPFGSITWKLTAGSADGVVMTTIDGSPVTLRVEGGRLGGTSACNSYSGPISIAAGTVTIGPHITMTEMACLGEGVMELEGMYLAALPRITSVEQDAAGNLVLRGDSVELRFTAQPEEPHAPLAGTTWVLESIIDGETSSTPVAEATLLIADSGRLSGSTGCNRMNGTYDDATGFSALSTTKMACKNEIMAQEDLVLRILDSAPTVSIEGPVLTIADLEGRALVYRAG